MEFSTGYLTVAQVCAILTIDRTTLYRMRRDGEFIEAVDITGGRIGFPIPEFHAWNLKRAQARGGPRKQRGLIRCRPSLPARKPRREEPPRDPPKPRGSVRRRPARKV